MTYLITGATGDVGPRVVECLLQRGQRPRVFVRNETKARSRFGERVDIFVGDLADPASLKPALEGVDALFLVNTGPQIPALDEAAAKVAKAAGVKHLVKLSSMDVQQGLAIGAWHERGEAAVRASGVPFTFVQPTGFMSNLLAWAPSIKAEGVVRASTGAGSRAFIHSADIAAVATKALTTRGYVGESLPITGREALNYAEVTAKVGAANWQTAYVPTNLRRGSTPTVCGHWRVVGLDGSPRFAMAGNPRRVAGKYNGQRRTHSGSQADYDGSLGDGERGGVPLMRNAFGSGLWTNT